MLEKSIIQDWLERPFLFDKIGRTVIEKDSVFRIITDPKHIQLYKSIISSNNFPMVEDEGLIATSIAFEDQKDDILVIEHEKIHFILNPSEYTSRMFWDAAIMYVRLCKKMYECFNVLTVDAHPWNISFHGTTPKYLDFSSFYKGDSIHLQWFNEFKKYFATPIHLASKTSQTYALAKLYRREHLEGFGISIIENEFFEKKFSKKFDSLYKYSDRPIIFFENLIHWLERNKPLPPNKEYWANYQQAHESDYLNPKTIKQKFVFDYLVKTNPNKVLDLATNRGFYAIMAEKLGAKVIGFDYEEETIDQLRDIAKGLDSSITPALMNFSFPTPSSGVGLMVKNAFDRFKSDVVLALGLIHHICITQKIPVVTFCEICMNYADEAIILEFVHPDDVHLANWNAEIPSDYSIERITQYFSKKFSEVNRSELINHDNIHREILSFSKPV